MDFPAANKKNTTGHDTRSADLDEKIQMEKSKDINEYCCKLKNVCFV